MDVSLDMLTAIEQATIEHLVRNIPAFKSSAIQKDARQQLRDIVLAVAILEGKFEKVGQACFRSNCTVNVLLKFKNLQSEEARRKGINPLVMAAFQCLIGQKLGLEIGRLVPVRFRDVTTAEKYDAATIEYMLEFSTWFDIRQMDENDLNDLVTMAIDYLLTPGDATSDASDTLTTVV